MVYKCATYFNRTLWVNMYDLANKQRLRDCFACVHYLEHNLHCERIMFLSTWCWKWEPQLVWISCQVQFIWINIAFYNFSKQLSCNIKFIFIYFSPWKYFLSANYVKISSLSTNCPSIYLGFSCLWEIVVKICPPPPQQQDKSL